MRIQPGPRFRDRFFLVRMLADDALVVNPCFSGSAQFVVAGCQMGKRLGRHVRSAVLCDLRELLDRSLEIAVDDFFFDGRLQQNFGAILHLRVHGQRPRHEPRNQ